MSDLQLEQLLAPPLPPLTPTATHLPLLAAVLARLNEPEAVPQLFDHALDHLAPDETALPAWSTKLPAEWEALDKRGQTGVVLAVRIREALLKSFPLIGFPLTISALTTFSTHLSKQHPSIWPAVERVESLHPFPTAWEPLGPGIPLHETKADGREGGKEQVLEELSRGRAFFNSVYGKVAGRVIESLRWGHPNLVDSALKLIYTPVLSDMRILTPLESSLLCLVLCFVSDLPPQTKGHFRGAQNHGATRDLLEPLLKAVQTLADWAPAGRIRVERMEFLREVGVEATPGSRL